MSGIEYPCFYTFKATVAAGPLSRARVVEHVQRVMGPIDAASVTVRASSRGKYESVSVHVYLRSEDDRRRVYEAFHGDKEIHWYV